MSRPKLGVTLPQFTDDRERLLEGASRAEALGFDSVWVFDHLWPLGAKHRPILEAWSALAAVAAVTDRIGIGTLVTRSSIRHPALLAKMAATVACIAPGRLTIAVGSGDRLSRAENEAFGLAYLSGPRRSSQLESVVRVLAGCPGDGAFSRDEFGAVAGLPGTACTQAPKVWVGGWSDHKIDLAAKVAAGWNGWGGSPQRLERAAAALRSRSNGRQVEISWGAQALLGPNDRAAGAKLGARDARHFVIGGPETTARRLTDMAIAGAEHLIIAFPDAGEPGPYELLAAEVRPRLVAYTPQGYMMPT